MGHRIVSVDRGSAAAKGGILPGDELIAVNGEVVIDFLDFQALTAEKRVALTIKRNGEKQVITLRKDEYAPTGLNFETPMMSGMRMCCNHCLFCFVDQLPASARPTMRVKDDDWRMSLMMGNYVTFTNVSDRELDRIIKRHASPLYISVHCTDPELRTRLLQTPRAAKIMEQLKKLSDGGIEFHCQAVLCPGLNDGEVLERSIRELAELPGALSFALVPVGLTNHRDGLCDLRKYTAEEAKEVIRIADRWREKLLIEKGTRFVFPSDEFYLQADVPLPDDLSYEGYEQIDDGVGLLRLLETEFADSYDFAEPGVTGKQGTQRLAIGCGLSAAPFLTDLMARYPLADLTVHGIENRFFGPNVTVSGLITGRDLTDYMKDVPCDKVLITECMLRSEGDRFLDDMTLEEATQRLGRPIIPVGRRGEDLFNTIIDNR